MVRLPADSAHTVAEVRGTQGRVVITNNEGEVVLNEPFDVDGPGWWAIREATAVVGRHRLTVRIDDVDPYRGLHEPMLPRRLELSELGAWRTELAESWQLIGQCQPEFVGALHAGLDSLVPGSATPLRSVSASTGESFGSALVARPDDAPTLAATLVHEFQHIALGGVLNLAQLYEDDPRERFYVPWRPDPRPLGGALQGIYAFFGIAGFWRAVVQSGEETLTRRAMFEFAQARSDAWRVLEVLRHDKNLTHTGRRFVQGIADTLKPWLVEPIPEELRRLAEAIAMDHQVGYRLRHLRPDQQAVSTLAEAWLAGHASPPVGFAYAAPRPTPVPDGTISKARADLIRLGVAMGGRRALVSNWRSVPEATTADLAFATGRFSDAVRGYRTELDKEPGRVSAWAGLGLALVAIGTGPATRALTHYPELVRAVHRRLADDTSATPTPESLAAWLGRAIY
jgi:hypothetical protein